MSSSKFDKIIDYLRKHPPLSSSEILNGLGWEVSPATMRRYLSSLVAENKLISTGANRGTRYEVSPLYNLITPIDLEQYFEQEIDDRAIKKQFNFKLIPLLAKSPIFSKKEQLKLDKLLKQFTQKTEMLTPAEYKKEMERLAIDLSWKSSQIEGNTYSLLETERLLVERQTASGKSLEEAKMLLNHKAALDYIIKNREYMHPLTVAKIEEVHSILIQELGIDRNIRKRRVGIIGTNYQPLDNEFQIREALEEVCHLVNSRENIFERAFLLLMLFSYVQPFNDGNKRTARILSNVALISNNYCPISFRTVDSMDYNKAILLFYEQNNISAFTKIFIEQFEFAVTTYF